MLPETEYLGALLNVSIHGKVVDEYAQQFDPRVVDAKTMERLLSISRSLLSSSILTFNTVPEEEGLLSEMVAVHVQALFMLGKRSGTLTFAVSDGE